MSILLFSAICCIISVCFIAYIIKKQENMKKTEENFYRRINLKNESDWKCGSCATYGSLFDYKKQKSDRTFGVANGCQKIF
jgi:hypothetical protein